MTFRRHAVTLLADSPLNYVIARFYFYNTLATEIKQPCYVPYGSTPSPQFNQSETPMHTETSRPGTKMSLSSVKL